MTTATAPSARTAKKHRAKPERYIRLLTVIDGGAGIFSVQEGEKIDKYFFAPLASDFGHAFTVEKWCDHAAGVIADYDVCLHGDESTCECAGFLRWHHCRHIEGLTALCEAGKLSSAPTAPVASKPAPCPHENVFQSDGDEIVCADCGCEL